MDDKSDEKHLPPVLALHWAVTIGLVAFALWVGYLAFTRQL